MSLQYDTASQSKADRVLSYSRNIVFIFDLHTMWSNDSGVVMANCVCCRYPKHMILVNNHILIIYILCIDFIFFFKKIMEYHIKTIFSYLNALLLNTDFCSTLDLKLNTASIQKVWYNVYCLFPLIINLILTIITNK